MPKENDLSVWWFPQIPGKPFRVAVNSPEEGKKIMDVLAEYDLFQYESNIKPDYANAGGLDVFEDGEWVTWLSDDGQTIDEWA